MLIIHQNSNKSLKASTINVKDIATTDETNLDNVPFMDVSRLKEVAQDAIEKYKERSVNLGTTSMIDKSVREAVKFSSYPIFPNNSF